MITGGDLINGRQEDGNLVVVFSVHSLIPK